LRVINSATACEDIDSLDPLVRLVWNDPTLRERTQERVRRAASWVLYNFNEDGGAVFQRSAPFMYGHPLMASRADQSSIFATWFRTLSLAMACALMEATDVSLRRMPWRFLDAPGLQFSPDLQSRKAAAHAE